MTEQAADEVRRARAELNDLPVRTLLPHEHDAVLRLALNSSRRRLLIAGGAVTAEHVDGRFMKRLRQILKAGALVRILVSGAATGNERALEGLRTAAGDYPDLIVDELEMKDGGLLISDDRFVAYGAFAWLGQLGDRERSLTDTRSLLVRDPEAIDEAWARLDGRTPGSLDPPPAPQPRGRHPRRRGGARPRERGGPSK